MRKVIAAISGGPDQTPRDFQNLALNEIGPRLAAMSGVRKLTLNLVQSAPDFLPVPPANSAAPHANDVILLVWLDDGAAPWLEHALTAQAGCAHWYGVDEIVEKSELPIVQGRVTPGIRNVPLIVCQDGLDPAARREKWRHHGALGLRIHSGMKRYVRNIVEETLTEGAPIIHGIGEVCFPSLDDLRYGLFPSPEDRRAFLDDIAGWVKASTAQYATEHVLKW